MHAERFIENCIEPAHNAFEMEVEEICIFKDYLMFSVLYITIKRIRNSTF